MIFQYTRTVSELDSKRHYEWKLVSDQHEHVFQFLSPNGNRYSKIIPNTIGHPFTSFETMASLAPKYLDEAELEMYQKLVVNYPMIPHVVVKDEPGEDAGVRMFVVWFRVGDNCEYEHERYILLKSVVHECHLTMINIENAVLELDEERKSKQQMFALCNELTNVLTKVDVLQCLQQLTVKDSGNGKDQDEKHSVKPLTLREDLRCMTNTKSRNGNSLERRECMFPLASVKRQKFHQ